MGQSLQCITRLFQLGNAGVERHQAFVREGPHARAVIARIEIEQLLDLLKRETGTLRLLDKAKAAHILGTVAADSVVPRWRLQESASLVEAHRFDANTTRCGEASDGE